MKPLGLVEFAKKNPARKGPVCSVCLLPDELRKPIDEHLLARDIPVSVVSRWLMDECGRPEMNRQRIEHHRLHLAMPKPNAT